ncbi:MAG: acyl-CoA dehydrogenase family protein [Steroidobacteraceae bacterium]|jgi:alkylation response protein AidB-like acyl-CoA dehydrogenase
MDFDYTSEQRELQAQARRFLAEHCPPSTVRRALDVADGAPDLELLKAIADLGWLGVAIPESEGGIGLGHVELCALAEELGRALLPGPFASSVYFFAETLRVAGSVAQRQRWLPLIASGDAIGCTAFYEGVGELDSTSCEARVEGGRLYGIKQPVVDGMAADACVVMARDSDGLGLFLAAPLDDGVERTQLHSIDGSRPLARLRFDGVEVDRLGGPGEGIALARRTLERAAVPLAFEQVGAADRCLEMARDYALQRRAFGRPIGSFQAIKHRLADMYVRNELARSNAYYAAWALATDAPQLGAAAAAARIAATEAFEFAARENIQVHGGIAITWEADPQLFLRRARHCAVVAGSADWWAEQLVTALTAVQEV